MKLKLIILTLLGLSFSGCTNSMNYLSAPVQVQKQEPVIEKKIYEKPTPEKQAAFNLEKRKVGLSTKNDPNYKSFSAELNTTEQQIWFNNLMYRLWDRQIVRSQFIAEGVEKFPTHHYEFTFIANGF